MHDCLPYLEQHRFPAISRRDTATLQINIGLKCNQQCVHCHVNASPKRTEMMSGETLANVRQYLDKNNIATLDITGGAPELHPGFMDLVEYACERDIHVIDRCNLTVLFEPGMDELPEFLAQHKVEIVASLPCYSMDNVDRQRGDGVFARSIAALQKLNSYGYGMAESELKLNLVYNPQGPALPPSQAELQQAYQEHLYQDYGIRFNELYTLCNMPIKRFGSMLISNKQLDPYLELLTQSHRDENLEGVMCRDLISVDWQGYVYDCDFNQMLGINIMDSKTPIHLSELIQQQLSGKPIAVRAHCFGCTAGQGSSCGGALS
ncbi:MAG: arsenosugar biosynthesis radical SAM protein ArsS [Gammaproteobacteria bacterium]